MTVKKEAVIWIFGEGVLCVCANCPPVSPNGTSNQCTCFTERLSINGYTIVVWELGNWPIKVQLGSTNSKGLPVLFHGSHQGLFRNSHCLRSARFHGGQVQCGSSSNPIHHCHCDLLSCLLSCLLLPHDPSMICTWKTRQKTRTNVHSRAVAPTPQANPSPPPPPLHHFTLFP